MTTEFRAGEVDVDVRSPCTECGKPAEGNVSWSDGEGEICDACSESERFPEDHREGEPCDCSECEADNEKELARYRAERSRATPAERNPEAYRRDMIEGGRGDLIERAWWQEAK